MLMRFYLDMGRILGQVADEGISVINFSPGYFRRHGPRFDFLVT